MFHSFLNIMATPCLLIRVETPQLPLLRRALRLCGAPRSDYRLVEHGARIGIALAARDRSRLETLMTGLMRLLPRAEFGPLS
ncbi:transposase (partial) [Bordetella hinzii]|uniref:N-acetyltransferase YedL n=2 Tax=Bordetella hinzii TaxID=103855 RepID=A0ABR4R6B2_9BORD|nr:hypothetical protein L544_3184 [Bordetella hinzii OH87 BAL007II]KCB31173.1 hypothetical protein L543_3071 [Bordetella hinzii L60]KCB32527.1 hypothetical protein L541_3273 [Bordetella hinzii CA90 BAL1384]KCB41237.1 hypothetical protein L539_3542 [Bordetella hinzii 5132]KCB52666.1 hypothetical protein L537_3516 [Bordetella hinzii 1277]KXA74491.1 hypothetical protein AXA74_03440 [Bordetella hinzii LMG 13501]QDJ31386.1 hypothetical protein CBR68_03190 [Bordetella hinzii]